MTKVPKSETVRTPKELLKAEEEALRLKVEKLHTFLFRRSFNALEEPEQIRLVRKEACMLLYLAILQECIGDFEELG